MASMWDSLLEFEWEIKWAEELVDPFEMLALMLGS
jgi:hypothetical protein